MANLLTQINPLEAASYVQQQGEAGRARGQQNMLTQLASQAYTAAPEQQSSILGQMAAIDPKAAQAQQAQFESVEDRRNKTLANMAGLLVKAPEQARAGIYQRMLPDLQRFGVEAPAAYDSTTAPIIDQTATALYQAYSSAGQTPTDVRSFQMMTAGLSAEDREKARRIATGLDPRQSSAAITYQKVMGTDGVERLVAVDPRQIGAQVVGDGAGYGSFAGGAGSGQPAASGAHPAQETILAAANMMAQSGIASDRVDAWVQEQLSQPAARGTGTTATGANAFAGRRPEDTEAAKEAARLGVQQSYLPTELQMRTQDAVQRAGATTAIEANAKRQAEQQGQREERTRDANDTLSLLDQAEKLLPNATGGRAGQLGDAAAAAFGVSTTGAQATAQLQTIAGQLTSKMPRMQGPQSDRDVQLYQQMAGDLANPNVPVATRQAALRTIRVLQKKYTGDQPGPSGGGQQPAPNGSTYSNLWN